MKIEVGACEAKTRLPELLRQVKAGKQFTITTRGEAIADLIPSEANHRRDAATAIEKFRAFLRANPVAPQKGVAVRKLITEGRL